MEGRNNRASLDNSTNANNKNDIEAIIAKHFNEFVKVEQLVLCIEYLLAHRNLQTFSLTAVSNSSSAINNYMKVTVDYVILDLIMPFLKQIRAAAKKEIDETALDAYLSLNNLNISDSEKNELLKNNAFSIVITQLEEAVKNEKSLGFTGELIIPYLKDNGFLEHLINKFHNILELAKEWDKNQKLAYLDEMNDEKRIKKIITIKLGLLSAEALEKVRETKSLLLNKKFVKSQQATLSIEMFEAEIKAAIDNILIKISEMKDNKLFILLSLEEIKNYFKITIAEQVSELRIQIDAKVKLAEAKKLEAQKAREDEAKLNVGKTEITPTPSASLSPMKRSNSIFRLTNTSKSNRNSVPTPNKERSATVVEPKNSDKKPSLFQSFPGFKSLKTNSSKTNSARNSIQNAPPSNRATVEVEPKPQSNSKGKRGTIEFQPETLTSAKDATTKKREEIAKKLRDFEQVLATGTLQPEDSNVSSTSVIDNTIFIKPDTLESVMNSSDDESVDENDSDDSQDSIEIHTTTINRK